MRTDRPSAMTHREYSLFVAPGATSCDIRGLDFKLMQSTQDGKPLELPSTFQGVLRVRARVGDESAMSDWKQSEDWVIGPASAKVANADMRCPLIVADMSFDRSDSTSGAVGWSTPEGWGTWTIGRTATLRPITVPKKLANTSLLLRLDARAFIAKRGDTQQVKVRANGTLIDTWTFADSEPKRMVSAIVPKALFKAKSSVVLSFEIGHPASPVSVGLSADSRELGLGVERLTLEELQ